MNFRLTIVSSENEKIRSIIRMRTAGKCHRPRNKIIVSNIKLWFTVKPYGRSYDAKTLKRPWIIPFARNLPFSMKKRTNFDTDRKKNDYTNWQPGEKHCNSQNALGETLYTYWNPIGILSSNFLSLGLPFFKGMLLLVLELHFVSAEHLGKRLSRYWALTQNLTFQALLFFTFRNKCASSN